MIAIRWVLDTLRSSPGFYELSLRHQGSWNYCEHAHLPPHVRANLVRANLVRANPLHVRQRERVHEWPEHLVAGLVHDREQCGRERCGHAQHDLRRLRWRQRTFRTVPSHW